MKRIMVTGATAPVGRALVDSLLRRDDVEYILAVGLENHPNLSLDSSRLRYCAVDLTRSRSVRELLFGPVRELGIEVVVHTALHRSPSDTGPRIHRLNVEATRQILHLCDRHPTIRRFVYRSFSEVYRREHDQPYLIEEEHPLDLSPRAPQRVRDRVEADLTVCTRMGLSKVDIIVLRCAEILTANDGSQLWDYLSSAVCLRPLGFDPMLNVLTVADAVVAIERAINSSAVGICNIPGMDTVALSQLIENWRRADLPIPGPMLRPLYRLRRILGTEFDYSMNTNRFHFGGVLDGTRARHELGYEPATGVDWSAAPAPIENGLVARALRRVVR